MDLVKNINNVFDNENIRMFTIMITGVFAGYTLHIAPTQLSALFDNSVLFKFIILMLIGFSNFHPMTNQKIVSLMFISALILVVFEGFRRYY